MDTHGTQYYVFGGEVCFGERTLLRFHAMLKSVVDKTSLTTSLELSRLYGHEVNLISNYPNPTSN